MTDRETGVTYRLSEPGDLAEIQRLWAEETAWGPLGDEVRNWYASNPSSGSIAVVAAEPNGRIVGEFVFMGAEVAVNGRIVHALRPIAPIVSRSLRFTPTREQSVHPFFGMYRYGVEVARAKSVALFYTLPDPRWARLFRTSPVLEHITFPLWSVPLESSIFPQCKNCDASKLVEWDESVEELWRKTSRLHSCLTLRDRRTLRWKGSRPGYEVTAVHRNRDLIGIVVSRTGSSQWTLCDVLAADGSEALRLTLSSICNLAQRRSSAAVQAGKKISILAIPFLQSVLTDIGFIPDDYEFPFVVHLIGTEITRDEVAPARWYISAND